MLVDFGNRDWRILPPDLTPNYIIVFVWQNFVLEKPLRLFEPKRDSISISEVFFCVHGFQKKMNLDLDIGDLENL